MIKKILKIKKYPLKLIEIGSQVAWKGENGKYQEGEVNRGREQNAFSGAGIKIKSFVHDITEFWSNSSPAQQDVD